MAVETDEQKYDKVRVTAWNNALEAFGFGYIFDLRAARYARLTNWIKVLGILVPVILGAMAGGYGLDNDILKVALWVSIPISVFQVGFSSVAVVYKWDDELAYSIEASQELSQLSASFKKLGNFPPDKLSRLKSEFDLLDERYSARKRQNTKHELKAKELRKGMRYALREFQRPCAGCKEVPKSTKATDCPVCGKF